MENLITVLICAPIVMALIMALVSNDKVRGILTYLFGTVIAGLAVTVAVLWFKKGEVLTFDLPQTEIWDHAILVLEYVLMLVIIYLSVKAKKGIISVLAIVQTCLVTGLELFGPKLVIVRDHMKMDWLSVIMILIIGIVGVGIGIYAVGYMRGYHVHHSEVKDRRAFFFSIMFLFYGAMFGLVTSANLIWLYFFWEVTSVCSFLLIGYTQTEEATNNSFKALWMNLLGGLGIALAIAFAFTFIGSVDLYFIVKIASQYGNQYGLLIPIALLGFAALTKSAQFPFSGWLLGAMVAPTPSSALLHSATMVKAGVYLLVRIAIAMNGNTAGQMIYLAGGFTFFMASVLAISQSDGKKVLAYSTISNLGLIVGCAGIGTKETIWAAAFLIIFHAITKSMMFQCVGAIENSTGSRDIEDMQGLALRYPKLAFILMLGIAGMFLAPFGMLISKWAALKAFVDAPSTIMVLFIAFGSATTMFYWTKWFAKILGIGEKNEKDVTEGNEYFSMFAHAIMLLIAVTSLPIISIKVVEPYVKDVFGSAVPAISESNIWTMVILVSAIFVIPLITYGVARSVKHKDVMAYMGGANTGDNKNFVDAMGEAKELKVSNWYLDDWFGEAKLFKPAMWGGIAIILIFLGIVIGGAL
ncbi:NADH-quinone oxidoreductase subunit L [Eubacterium xylanophilum]|uniref:NADH-quinone oxidoreductase subunit 5 family protein n=1 Tax=Eubacterium xylanophilum TaxID=39497 RepID=UPI00047A2804|nr:proton-conducting transporter membrane subunit [Eubacterium xylanophilum]MCR5797967.1 NADH-quinone oxidoreductase subunit L [Eubacterium sp.]